MIHSAKCLDARSPAHMRLKPGPTPKTGIVITDQGLVVNEMDSPKISWSWYGWTFCYKLRLSVHEAKRSSFERCRPEQAQTTHRATVVVANLQRINHAFPPARALITVSLVCALAPAPAFCAPNNRAIRDQLVAPTPSPG